jgi:hypothetical protein
VDPVVAAVAVDVIGGAGPAQVLAERPAGDGGRDGGAGWDHGDRRGDPDE